MLKKVVWSGVHHCDIFKSSTCGPVSKAYRIGIPAVPPITTEPRKQMSWNNNM